MKGIGFFLFVLTFSLFLPSIGAQSHVIGTWSGELKVQGNSLPMIFEFQKPEGEEFVCLLSIPLQSVREFPASRIDLSDSIIAVYFDKFAAHYVGKVSEDKQKVIGQWKQSGQNFDLELIRDGEAVKINRPQEPKPPFNYRIEEVSFENPVAQGITLAGTLTIPSGAGPFPAVILVSGSGPQDRNEEMMTHKPFWVLADHLTNRGIAVLRYDDRGVGASGGTFATATTQDFATDAMAAVDFLRNSNWPLSKVGILGHSEGGLIAPVVVSSREDVDFAVLLAGPGLPGDEILISQAVLISQASGTPDENIRKDTTYARAIYQLIKSTPADDKVDFAKFKEISLNYYENASDEVKQVYDTFEKFYFTQSSQLTSPWFRQFLTYDPQPVLRKMKKPLLAVNGTLDLQVPYQSNLEAIRKALVAAENPHFQTKALSGLNHLFQKAKTGSPAEYSQIEETFNVEALELISNWITKTVNQ